MFVRAKHGAESPKPEPQLCDTNNNTIESPPAQSAGKQLKTLHESNLNTGDPEHDATTTEANNAITSIEHMPAQATSTPHLSHKITAADRLSSGSTNSVLIGELSEDLEGKPIDGDLNQSISSGNFNNNKKVTLVNRLKEFSPKKADKFTFCCISQTLLIVCSWRFCRF